MSHKLVSLHIGDGEYYTRIDADAVIAELKADYKEACDRLQTANLIKDEQLAAARHHKYKRCLAMVGWCHNQKEIYERDSYDWELEVAAKCSLWNKAKIMRKWHERWLELAEQFNDKEAK